jgi:DnaK suppressor protein
MDEAQAQDLLAQERSRLERLLRAGPEAAAGDLGDEVDDAGRRLAEEEQGALEAMARGRLAALRRAEERLAAGTYGRSVRSGRPIPDERLEADPLAELTVDEAAAAEPGGARYDAEPGLVSADSPFEVLADQNATPEEALADEADDDEPAAGPDPGIRADEG